MYVKSLFSVSWACLVYVTFSDMSNFTMSLFDYSYFTWCFSLTRLSTNFESFSVLECIRSFGWFMECIWFYDRTDHEKHCYELLGIGASRKNWKNSGHCFGIFLLLIICQQISVVSLPNLAASCELCFGCLTTCQVGWLNLQGLPWDFLASLLFHVVALFNCPVSSSIKWRCFPVMTLLSLVSWGVLWVFVEDLGSNTRKKPKDIHTTN